MKKTFILTSLLFWSAFTMCAQKSVELFSPSKDIKSVVKVENQKMFYSVYFKGREILKNMPLSMTFDNGIVAGEKVKSLKHKTQQKEEIFEPVIAVRNSKVKMVYNETEFKGKKYDVVFRLYDDAVGYRFVTNFGKKEVRVMREQLAYRFSNDSKVLFPQENSMYTHQERKFVDTNLEGIADGKFCSHPLVVTDDNVRMLITEVDLESYPGVFYVKKGKLNLEGDFPYYPLTTKKRSDRDMVVTKRADYMAKTIGNRAYPWRVVLLTDSDVDLLNSNTLYSMASKSRISDPSWIKTGKVAWDWWNGCTLTGVDFKSGVNTRTYKGFIDFASKYGLDYIILDEGWYDIRKSILDIVPNIDLKEIIAYGKQKKVDVILWTTWLALEENMDEAFARYKAMGVKGFKIDFMQRDDQWMVDWYYSTAKKAAEHHLLVDYHGAYKPTGLTRTYPNVLTTEGVYGGEQNKWTDDLTPKHNVTLAFTRMALGPMDYTPGAMRNSLKGQYISRFYAPMSQGTRCHQLGMYVIYESPLQMLSDSPSNYEKEPDMMKFLANVPVVWDETKALAASLGEYVVMARRSGSKWWLGGMCDWTSRKQTVTLDFLDEGKNYTMTVWEDGYNVHKNAEDYRMTKRQVKKGDKVSISFAPGGGFVATIE